MAVGAIIETSKITAPSDDYLAMLSYWTLVNTLIAGIDAMKKATTQFLPKLPGEDEKRYNFRLENAFMTNVYGDIVDTLSSKPFTTPIVIEDASKTVEDFALDVDGSGNDITSFTGDNFFNCINQAVSFIFVDMPKSEVPGPISVEQAKAIGNRPYWSHILGSNVFEARTQMINGAETLVYIRIFEPGSPNRVRVLEFKNGKATFELWEEIKDKGEYKSIEDGEITIGVIPIVWFISGRRIGRTFTFRPMLRAAAELQKQLYRKENNLNHAEIMTAFPMIGAAGVRPPRDAEDKPMDVVVSPGAILWAAPDGLGNFGSFTILEPGASSLAHLASQNDKLINQIRELGKMPLTAQSTQLTVITTAIAAGKAKTAIGQVAMNYESGLEQCLEYTLMWMGEAGDPKVIIDKTFDDVDDASNDKDKDVLTTMRGKRDLSQPTYWREMKARGVLSDDFDEKAEIDLLAKEAPDPLGADPTLDELGNPIATPPTIVQ